MVMSVFSVYEQQPGYWYQQQLIPGVTLPAGAPMPNTFVPLLFAGVRPGAGVSMPNSLCEVQLVFLLIYTSTIMMFMDNVIC